VLDPTTGAQTEINERGPSVSAREVELFANKLLYLARGAAIVVFAGSLPRGVEPEIYASLIRDLERLDVITVVDTDGEPLRQAVRAEPDVVSPNVLEAEELVGHEFSGEDERAQVVAEIAALGPREAIMTLPDGCFAQVLIDGQRRLKRARIEPREPVARSGSGDAFLAGYLAARYEGRAPDHCLRFGVACGAESTGRLGAGLIDAREARRLMGDVELTVIDQPAQVS
jgi:1-phosphofructokinase/tagatose 6-phosphate kinase